MAGDNNIIPGIEERFLQIEPKEDSAQKLAYIQGKLSKFFLFATEFEIIRAFVNLLRTDFDLRKRRYKVCTGCINALVLNVQVYIDINDNELGQLIFTNTTDGHLDIENENFSNKKRVIIILSGPGGVRSVSSFKEAGTNKIRILGFSAGTSNLTNSSFIEVNFEIRVYDDQPEIIPAP